MVSGLNPKGVAIMLFCKTSERFRMVPHKSSQLDTKVSKNFTGILLRPTLLNKRAPISLLKYYPSTHWPSAQGRGKFVSKRFVVWLWSNGMDYNLIYRKSTKTSKKLHSLKREVQTSFKMQRDLWLSNFLQAWTRLGELIKCKQWTIFPQKWNS